jgi:hypothetical protein
VDSYADRLRKMDIDYLARKISAQRSEVQVNQRDLEMMEDIYERRMKKKAQGE